MIWPQVKRLVAENNEIFITITEVGSLAKQAMSSITPAVWKKVVDHSEKVTKDAWKMRGLLKEDVELMILHFGDSSSSEENDQDSESTSEMEGCWELPFKEY